MKFGHMADCHIGGWRDPKLSALTVDAFNRAIDDMIKKDVDFVLISGDLFNTALPGIDKLKAVVERFKELSDCGIRVYMVPGSHDRSLLGKTMLDVLESAGLIVNVVKGVVRDGKLQLKLTADPSGALICGMLGKKGMLEKSFYKDLDMSNVEHDEGYKIFMFHTALDELKSKELEKMRSAPVSLLPKGFDYYAGGHVHERIEKNLEGYKKIVYPGPTFPNNFREIEKLKHGGYYIVDTEKEEYLFVPIMIKKVLSVEIDCGNRSPEEVQAEIDNMKIDPTDKIITLRIKGKINGRLKDVNIGKSIRELYEKGAYFVMNNSTKVISTDYEEIKVSENSVPELESKLIEEHAGQGEIEGYDTRMLINKLMQTFSIIKNEDETKKDFEERLISETDKVIFDE